MWSEKEKNVQYILNTLCTLLPIVPNAQIETYWYINKEEKRAKSQPSIFRIRRKKNRENSRKGGQRNRKGARDKRALKIKGFQAEFLKRIREHSLLPVKYYRRLWLWKYKRLSSATRTSYSQQERTWNLWRAGSWSRDSNDWLPSLCFCRLVTEQRKQP